jgi:hypothetical protein
VRWSPDNPRAVFFDIVILFMRRQSHNPVNTSTSFLKYFSELSQHVAIQREKDEDFFASVGKPSGISGKLPGASNARAPVNGYFSLLYT